VGFHPLRERMDLVTRLTGLPQGLVPFALLPMGYPAETPKAPERFQEDWIHSERW
jgi:nitroreductase